MKIIWRNGHYSTIMYCKSSKYENQSLGQFIYALVGLFSLIKHVKVGRMTRNMPKKILVLTDW